MNVTVAQKGASRKQDESLKGQELRSIVRKKGRSS
mgnify:CR=1 FL=1